jgi:hypothetical protein
MFEPDPEVMEDLEDVDRNDMVPVVMWDWGEDSVAWGCGEDISSGGRWKGVVDDLTGRVCGVLERVSESR